jgi:tRNA (mo5U34)-methyltransferase
VSSDDYDQLFATVPYWFHQIEVAPGVVTPGIDRSREKLESWELPEDLTGKRVLDIGCYEGFFSFECERRGAEVLAIDLWAPGANGFELCKKLLGSAVDYRQASVYDLSPESFGEFDLVLFVGVLYHLRHPLLGLERVRSVCRERAVIETQICDECFIGPDGRITTLSAIGEELSSTPIAQFYPGAELNRDPSNWFSPNLTALQGWLVTSGFSIDRIISNGVRACVHTTAAEPAEEMPNIFAR